MLCEEYFPKYTHSDEASCKNCRYNGGYVGCTNVNIIVALQRNSNKNNK